MEFNKEQGKWEKIETSEKLRNKRSKNCVAMCVKINLSVNHKNLKTNQFTNILYIKY